jgi:uncharacterized membrane protein YesL
MTEETGSSSARWILSVLAGGAVLGFAGSSLGGPSVISWWYEPPSKDAFSCASSVRTALSQFVTMQLISAGIGAVGLALIVYVIRRALKNRAQNRQAVPS